MPRLSENAKILFPKLVEVQNFGLDIGPSTSLRHHKLSFGTVSMLTKLLRGTFIFMGIDIAGLKIDSLTKPELFSIIQECMILNQKIWITTPYSEFLRTGLNEPKIMEMLNKADIAVPDGIGIFWAHRFLSMPLTTQNYWFKIIQAYWQVLRTLLSCLSSEASAKGERGEDARRAGEVDSLKDRIPGSQLVWDIARLAAENNLSMYLLGGFGDTPKIVSEKLQNFIKRSVSPKVSGRLKVGIAGYSNKNPGDGSVIADIQKAKSDILLVAYGPIKQEQWILENRDKLPSVKLFMGVGGTFDYIAGKRLAPPKFIRAMGLEWLWRLFTQPYRIKRIYNATVGLITMLIKFKVFSSMPLRQNAVAIILNSQNQILVCKRSLNNPEDKLYGYQKKDIADHWQFPQGGVDGTEDLMTAGMRECKEEVGLTEIKFLAQSPKTHIYHYYNALRPFLRQHSRFKGQEQYILYFRHLANDRDAKVDNVEFEDYKWIGVNDLDKILHKFRLPLAKIVTEDLKEMAEKAIIDM